MKQTNSGNAVLSLSLTTLVFVQLMVSCSAHDRSWVSEDFNTLTHTKYQHNVPQWSHDGSRILIEIDRSHPTFIIASDASNYVVLPFETERNTAYTYADTGFKVSPTEPRVVYSTLRHFIEAGSASSLHVRTMEIETANFEGSDIRRLTTDADLNTAPVWSPDGARIAFVKYHNSLPVSSYYTEPLGNNDFLGIYTMDADGSDARRIYPLHDTDYRFFGTVRVGPTWAPDGESLAYVLIDWEQLTSSLLVMNANGTSHRELIRIQAERYAHWPDIFPLVGGSIESFSWSPEGNHIAFAVYGGNKQGVYTIRPDGTGLRQLHDRNTSQVQWSPSGLELLVNGGYILRADGSGPGRLIAPLYTYGDIYLGAGLAYGHGWGAWSPDESRIVIYRPYPGGEGLTVGGVPPRGPSLFTVAQDGTDVRVLAWGNRTQGLHVCSSDGEEASLCTKGGNGLHAYNPEMKADYETLLEIRDTIAGDATLNWSPSQPVTAWDGLRVSGSPPRVTKLDLRERGLTGVIPPEMGRLTGLTGMGLAGNNLTGAVPPELGHLTELNRLTLENNALTGAIPPELGKLEQLHTLSLGGNALTGPVPPELGRMGYGYHTFYYLNLSGNNLSGSIPAELSALGEVHDYLDVSGNALTGCVPHGLGEQWVAASGLERCESEGTERP